MKNQMMMKLIAVILIFNIITMPIYSCFEKKVYADEVLLTKNLTHCIMLVTAGIAAIGFFQDTQKEYTNQQINNIADYITNSKPELIANINKLGDAIGKNADKLYIQSLATGGVIYALLDALTMVKFNSGTIPVKTTPMYKNAIKYEEIENYSSQFQFYKTDGTSDYYYLNQYSRYFKGGYPLLHPINEMNTANADYWYFSISNLVMPIENKYIQIYIPRYFKSTKKWDDEINSSGKYLAQMMTISRDVYYSKYLYDYEYTIAVRRVSASMDFFIDNGLISNISADEQYENGITYSLTNLNSIALPSFIPADTVADVNDWDGISELVIGLPVDYVIPSDDLIIVDPTTVGNPDIEIPIDPPIEEDSSLIATVAAILAGITPISGLLDNIFQGELDIADVITVGLTDVIDGIGDIAGTLTGGITSTLTDIQTAINDFVDPSPENVEQLNLDPIKNIPAVLFSRFPFSIPFDFYNIIAYMGGSAREAPEFNFTIPLSSIGQEDVVKVIDMEPFDHIAGLVRIAELIAFSIAVMLKTKTLIWG